MSDEFDAVREKVASIVSVLSQSRTQRIDDLSNTQIREIIATAISSEYGQERAKEIAFHLTDWICDAAFLVALHLFPEQFTPEEVDAGVGLLLVHAPNHLAAAATLSNNPIEDVFDVGAEEKDPTDER
jgi:hypothetical protein